MLVLVDGGRMLDIMERLEMDERELSRRSGISVKTVKEMLESNHHRPATVKKVARALGVHHRSLALSRQGRLLGVA